MRKKDAESRAAKKSLVLAEILLLGLIIFRWLNTGKVLYDIMIVFIATMFIYFTLLLYYENYKNGG
ncbi:MAG: hypothetical protein J7K31_04110 [Candidatus Aenigmarchaeota archaeon]|nr:hypothetical protein [Candidatus Aenigmarchaeota archaeon]